MPLHKPVVMVFGRFNPPTTGHEALITFVKSVAHRVNGDVRVYASQSQDPRKNPLPFRNKVLFLRKFFPGVVVSDNAAIRSPFDALAEVSQLGYTDVILVVGSDRVQDFEKFGAYLLPRNSPKYDPNKHIAINNYKVVSVPVSRDPDAEGVSGMSASKMRKFAADNDYTSFRQGVPAHVSERDANSLFQQVRQYMGLHETFKITTGQFALPLDEATFYGPGGAFSKATQRALTKYGQTHSTAKSDVLTPGTRVKVPHKGHMTHGKIVRYDKGDGPHGSPYYVVDVGAYASEKIPAHKIVKESAELSEAHITANDQLRGARIIYKAMAGKEPAHGLVNPVDLINGAIREFLKKEKHTVEAWNIAGEMLTKARKELHIDWDKSLIRPATRIAMRLKEDHLKVGDKVHAGLAQRGGAGFSGVVDRIDGDYVYVNIGKDKYGDRIVKAPHRTVMKEADELSEAPSAMPLRGHAYHRKSDAELLYIIKDAGAAAAAMRGHNPTAEGKYLDQVNDASTVLYYRRHGGKQVTEADGGYTPAKPETETDRLRTSQQQELIALKTRQANQMMAAKLRDVQNKAREAQMKATQPKPAAKPAS